QRKYRCVSHRTITCMWPTTIPALHHTPRSKPKSSPPTSNASVHHLHHVPMVEQAFACLPLQPAALICPDSTFLISPLPSLNLASHPSTSSIHSCSCTDCGLAMQDASPTIPSHSTYLTNSFHTSLISLH